MNNNYVDTKRNCNRCGTIMTSGWSLTCPACITNEKLEEQNKILSQSVPSSGSGGSYSSVESGWTFGRVLVLALFIWIVIGFLFFPHWGIVTFVKFVGTVLFLIGSMVFVIPLFLWEVLF